MAIAKNIEIYVNGVNLANAFKSIDFAFERSMEDATTLNTAGARSYTPGLKTGTASANGIFAFDLTNTDEIDDVMKAAFTGGSDADLLASKTTTAQGGRIYMIEGGKIASWNYNPGLGTILFTDAEIQSQNGIEMGVCVFKGNDATVGTNGASVDNAASSANGGYFQAQLYELSDSAATDMNITLQHSTDDAAWADLVALQAVGAARGVVEGTVATGTTVNRYLRVQIQATTGKGYVVAAFFRR